MRVSLLHSRGVGDPPIGMGNAIITKSYSFIASAVFPATEDNSQRTKGRRQWRKKELYW
jgi:hypothetical protein